MSQPCQFTNGEIKALIAPIMAMNPEDIDNLVIITYGKCPDCGGRDNTAVYHDVDTMGSLAHILNNAILSQIPDDI